MIKTIPASLKSSVITTVNALFRLSIPLGTAIFGVLLNSITTPAILILTGVITLIGSMVFLFGEKVVDKNEI